MNKWPSHEKRRFCGVPRNWEQHSGVCIATGSPEATRTEDGLLTRSNSNGGWFSGHCVRCV